MAGLISISRLDSFARLNGIPAFYLDDFLSFIHFRHDFPFYVKSQGQIINNRVQMTLEKVEIGRMLMPDTMLNENQADITGFVQNYLVQGEIARKKKFSVKILRAQNGKLRFQGTLPSASPHWFQRKVEYIPGQQ